MRRWRWLLVGAYIAVIGPVTLHPANRPRGFPRPYNIVRFRSLAEQLSGSAPVGHRVFEIVGNLLMLTPLAAFLAWGWPQRREVELVAVCYAISVVIEVVQYGSGSMRSADVDDVLLNTLGAVIGVVLARRLARAFAA